MFASVLGTRYEVTPHGGRNERNAILLDVACSARTRGCGFQPSISMTARRNLRSTWKQKPGK